MTYNHADAAVLLHLSPVLITAALAVSGGNFYPILPLKLPFPLNPPAGPRLLAVLPPVLLSCSPPMPSSHAVLPCSPTVKFQSSQGLPTSA